MPGLLDIGDPGSVTQTDVLTTPAQIPKELCGVRTPFRKQMIYKL